MGQDELMIKNQREKLQELGRQFDKWMEFDWNEITEEIMCAWDGEESKRFLQKMHRNTEKLMGISRILKDAEEEFFILEQNIRQVD